MSAVIKAGDRSHGLAIAKPRFAALAAPGDLQDREAGPPDPHAVEIEELRDKLAVRDEEIAALRLAIEAARAEGEETGRTTAELEFEDDRKEHLERLERALIQSGHDAAAFVDRAEALSLVIARTALEKMFGEDPDRQDTIAQLVRRELDRIERDMVLTLEVSRLDFPYTAEVAALVQRLGLNPAVAVVSDELRAGDCRVRLRLGALEIGPNQQWHAVRHLLDEMAQTAEASA